MGTPVAGIALDVEPRLAESLWEAIMLDGQPLGEYPELGPTHNVEYFELLTLAYFARLMGYRI